MRYHAAFHVRFREPCLSFFRPSTFSPLAQINNDRCLDPRGSIGNYRARFARGCNNYTRLIIRAVPSTWLAASKRWMLFNLVTIHEVRYRSPEVAAANRTIGYPRARSPRHRGDLTRARGLCSPLLTAIYRLARSAYAASLSSNDKFARIAIYGGA